MENKKKESYGVCPHKDTDRHINKNNKQKDPADHETQELVHSTVSDRYEKTDDNTCSGR